MSNDLKYNDTARIAAGICGVSDNLVRKVKRGDRDNDLVFTVVMVLKEKEQEAIEYAKNVYEELTNKD